MHVFWRSLIVLCLNIGDGFIGLLIKLFLEFGTVYFTSIVSVILGAGLGLTQ